MRYVSEEAVQSSVDQAEVNAVVAEAFATIADGRAECWPVVRQTLGYADAVFGFKSGFNKKAGDLGIKAGGLWPGNKKRGLANHQSTVMLFDVESGSPEALIRATYLTALRTAAASALSVRLLARDDARVLGLIGAGGQAKWQLLALLEERPFEELLVYGTNNDAVEAVLMLARQRGITASACDPESLCRNSDVIVTLTPSRAPIVRSEWVGDGTHLACMGADTAGKQEVEPELVARSVLFGDVPEQAVVFGECQHAFSNGLIDVADITPLGQLLTGQAAVSNKANNITVFDSTGMAMQDIAAARLALERATSAGLTTLLP